MRGSLKKTIQLFPAAFAYLLVGCSEPPDTPLTEIQEFGSNPGELRMLKYLPTAQVTGRSLESARGSAEPNEVPVDGKAGTKDRALVVALHGCMQSAAEYAEDSGWIRLADRWDFLLLLPEQRRSNNLTRCFNWFSPENHRRDIGEALSIRRMVDRMQRDHAIDAQRIYVTGISAGAAMTLALVTVYPEVFAGGAPLAGIPFGCADGLISGLKCMLNPPDKGAAEWGTAVRAATSHTGPWPRISVWQGGADSAVDPDNATAIVHQWTNTHGIDTAPEQEDKPKGHLHELYRDSNGRVLVESHRIDDMGHGVPVDPGPGEDQCGTVGKFFPDVDICSGAHIARFWGLHQPRERTLTD
jgi:poly(hydroxyalkanoate) depolymerase family esterase